MKKELTMSEMNQVAGGKTEEKDFVKICKVSMSISEYWEKPSYDALCKRMDEMIKDEYVWSYDDVMAQLRAIDPSFHVVY